MNNIRLQIYDFLFIQTTIWVFLTLKTYIQGLVNSQNRKMFSRYS